MDVCPRCLMRFPRHIVIAARCTKRWRGANFDSAAAQGAVGAAVAKALGFTVRTNEELGRFYERAFVRAYGEGFDPNPTDEFDTSIGERFEFHVGLRGEMDDAAFAALETAAREAVATARHFVLV